MILSKGNQSLPHCLVKRSISKPTDIFNIRKKKKKKKKRVNYLCSLVSVTLELIPTNARFLGFVHPFVQSTWNSAPRLPCTPLTQTDLTKQSKQQTGNRKYGSRAAGHVYKGCWWDIGPLALDHHSSKKDNSEQGKTTE